jgi:hypothetical protein
MDRLLDKLFAITVVPVFAIDQHIRAVCFPFNFQEIECYTERHILKEELIIIIETI